MWLILLFCVSHSVFASDSWQITSPNDERLFLQISTEFDKPDIISLKKDEQTLFERKMNRVSLAGVCLDKVTASPSIILSETMEGVGVQQLTVLSHKTNWQALHFHHMDQLEDCYPAQTGWLLDDQPMDCICDFSEQERTQAFYTGWYSLLDSFPRGLHWDQTTKQLNSVLINDELGLNTLLTQARHNNTVVFDKFVDGNHWLIIEFNNGIYQSLSLGLVHQGKQWFVWYYVTGNSKAFHAIENIESPQTNELNATFCVEDCQWWGELANVNIDLANQSIEIMDEH